LSGISPFVGVRGPERNYQYGFGMGGGLIKEKSSFNLNVYGQNSYETPNLNVASANGIQSVALIGTRTPRDNLFVNGQLDYAVTLDQTLRFQYNLTRLANSNLGIGGYNKPERAFSTDNNIHNLRVAEYGPLGRRAFFRS